MATSLSILTECNQAFTTRPFTIYEKLGAGIFGAVHRAIMADGKEVAIKMIPKIGSNQQKTDLWLVAKEIAALERATGSKYIVEFCGVFENHRYIYIAMDYAPLGCAERLIKLFDVVHPQLAQRLLVDLLEAAQFLHSKGIIHLDIRLANVLALPTHFKLCDLGSVDIERGEFHYEQPPSDFPPEILTFPSNKYSEAADVWLIGVAVHRLITKLAIPTRVLLREGRNWISRYVGTDFVGILFVLTTFVLVDQNRSTIDQLRNNSQIKQWRDNRALCGEALEQLYALKSAPTSNLQPNVMLEQRHPPFDDHDGRLQRELLKYESKVQVELVD